MAWRPSLFTILLLAILCVSAEANYRAVDTDGKVTLQDISFPIPSGFRLLQDVKVDQSLFLNFKRGQDGLMVYVSSDVALQMKKIFGQGSQVIQDIQDESYGFMKWQTMQTSHGARAGRAPIHVKAFLSVIRGNTYYGYARSADAQTATAIAREFLNSVTLTWNRGEGRSLTGPEDSAKKYYFGWGAAGFSDPSMMHNEVKYDVLHTHDIFTKDIGGNYLGTKMIGTSTSGSGIRAEWNRLSSVMTKDDMYIQYSSGHGSTSGLGVGVTYNEMRDAALSFPAREIIIFTMACHSGGLVDAFNAKKTVWENWQNEGRTLMVMASSKKSETSSTGPGTDPDEASGPSGSAGSAFGHALWKALIGYADGYLDGVKDGFLTLGEIRDYSIMKTKQVGGHVPVVTGVYEPMLVMNKKPSQQFLESLVGGTELLTDSQIEEAIRELDAAMRIH